MSFSTTTAVIKSLRLGSCRFHVISPLPRRSTAAPCLPPLHRATALQRCCLPWFARSIPLLPASLDRAAPPPVFLDGKLYALTARPYTLRVFDTILVIDVASEVHCTYTLPETGGRYMLGMHAFEMRGKLCVAVDVICPRRLCFWVMLPLQSMGLPCSWELRYTIYMDDDHKGSDRLRCVWFDNGDRTLCYRMGNCLYKYDTTKDEQEAIGCFSKWDHRIQLPAAPWPENQQWNVYGGYRPSLLSPHLAFRLESESSIQQQNSRQHYEHALLHVVRCQKPSKKHHFTCAPNGTDGTDDHRVVKRVRGPTR